MTHLVRVAMDEAAGEATSFGGQRVLRRHQRAEGVGGDLDRRREAVARGVAQEAVAHLAGDRVRLEVALEVDARDEEPPLPDPRLEDERRAAGS